MTTQNEPTDAARAGAEARTAGIILVAASLLAILMMAHHPTAGTHDGAGLAAEIADKAQLSRFVHGVLIALIALQLFAFTIFCKRLGADRILVTAGLVGYAIGTGAMIGAALISGFVVSDLAAHYASLPGAEQTVFIDLARVCMTGNQALARLGVVAASAGIVLWSIVLVASRRSAWLGFVGIIAGVAPAMALLFGALHLDVQGMTLVVVCQAIWNVAVGAQLIRAKL
jgi:hypothetical protein